MAGHADDSLGSLRFSAEEGARRAGTVLAFAVLEVFWLRVMAARIGSNARLQTAAETVFLDGRTSRGDPGKLRRTR